MAVKRVLIVEDDRTLADVVSYNLKQQAYETLVSHDGLEGFNQARKKSTKLSASVSERMTTLRSPSASRCCCRGLKRYYDAENNEKSTGM